MISGLGLAHVMLLICTSMYAANRATGNAGVAVRPRVQYEATMQHHSRIATLTSPIILFQFDIRI